MYLSFIFIFYSNLREFADRKISLIASLILATTPTIFDHSTFAYTNLPYTIFLATGSIYLFTWLIKKKTIGYLVLAGVFTGLSTWTRSAEPFWMVNIFMLVLFSIYRFKKYLVPTLIYVISFLFIKEPWVLVSYYQSVSPGIGTTSPIAAEASSYAARLLGTTFNLARIGEVVVFIYQNVIVSWFPLLFLFIFCIFVNLGDIFKKSNTLFLVTILLHFVFLLCATYVFSFGYAGWSAIPDSARRMAMFFMPLMIFYIGLSLGELDINADKKIIRKV
jgi:4-amino-4-deoxy-L-arabinose transferase-like glycosyltransferase